MALQILENNGVFELEGPLNTTTSRFFIIYFEYIINTLKSVTVNIEKVNAMDASGAESLKTLLAIALRTNKKFLIIGNGSNDIYNDYKSTMVA
jgi:anti-anti-sigma regulatory factor